MSYYDDRHYHPTRDRYARFSSHGGPMDVVPGRNSSDSLDYPPSDYGYSYGGHGYPPPTSYPRRPHGSGSGHGTAGEYYGNYGHGHGYGGYGGRGYDDDDDDDDDGYYRRKPRHHRHRRHERREPRSPSSSSTSRSPPPPRRRKSFSDQALGALGLGSASGSHSHGDDRGRPRGSRHRSYSESPTRNRSRHNPRSKSGDRTAQAIRAAVTAGSIEAFRVRKDPGGWTGDKGKRILTAAITAGGTDGLVDKDPRKHEKRHIIESTLAGLATNHFVNGPRSRSRSRHGGHRREKSGHGKEVAAAGLLAAAGKKAYDRYQSKSSTRGRSTSRDGGGYDSGGSPRRSHGSKRRSKSVSDYINQGMAALGLEESKRDRERDSRDRGHGRRRRHHRHRDHDHRRSHYDDDDDDSDSGDSDGGSDYESRRRPRHGSSRYEREYR